MKTITGIFLCVCYGVFPLPAGHLFYWVFFTLSQQVFNLMFLCDKYFEKRIKYKFHG
jgi:hypothetical protein